MTSEIAEDIRKLVAKARLKDALDLLALHDTSNPSTLLQSRLSALNTEVMSGIITSGEESMRRNRIALDLLNWVAQLELVPAGAQPPSEVVATGERAIQDPRTRAAEFVVENLPGEDGNQIEVPLQIDRPILTDFGHMADEHIKLLFLAATPQDTQQLNTGRESRFKDLIRQFDQKRRIDFREEHGLSAEGFQNFIFTEDPHIIHYGGHGYREGIVLEGSTLSAPVLTDIIANSDRVQVVVLNACNTLETAKQLARFVPYVIGTRGPLLDQSAIAFARGFYVGIAAGKSVERSFTNGINTIKLQGEPDYGVPVLVRGVKA